MKSRNEPPRGSAFEKPLNLPSLARTGAGAPQAVPGTLFEVSYVEQRSEERLEDDRWLLLLSGELIIDLPHGDFRILEAGDSLRLPRGVVISCQPVQPAVLLWTAVY